MQHTGIALKIDVDTYRGIEDGAARLASCLRKRNIPASFFISLGLDNSGWAATRIFRNRGFLKKMRRTHALSVYGWRTALSGTLLPARPMGASHIELFRQWKAWGFEVSPHGYDHVLWHDQAAGWDTVRAKEELDKVVDMYQFIFEEAPTSFAAPGWQASEGTWQAMERLKLLYHSDTRGEMPYFPLDRRGARDEGILKTLEIPTTLPTWDEMLTWEGIGPENLVTKTLEQFTRDRLNVWTIHAEFEGTVYFHQFTELLERLNHETMEWVFLPDVARKLLRDPGHVSYTPIHQGNRPGRAGTVTCQTV